MLVQKLIIKEILRLLTKKFKLNSLFKYVFEKNELDEKVEMLEKENEEMKADILFIKQSLTKEIC